jgi:hypothetical protein
MINSNIAGQGTQIPPPPPPNEEIFLRGKKGKWANGSVDPGPSVSRPENDADHDYDFSGQYQMHSIGIIATQSLHYIVAANSQPGEAPVVHTCLCMYRITNDFTSLFHTVRGKTDDRQAQQ